MAIRKTRFRNHSNVNPWNVLAVIAGLTNLGVGAWVMIRLVSAFGFGKVATLNGLGHWHLLLELDPTMAWTALAISILAGITLVVSFACSNR